MRANDSEMADDFCTPSDGQASVVKIADAAERGESIGKRILIYGEMLGHHGVDEYDRTSVHIVAIHRGRLVAALRLVGPTPLTVELSQFLNLAEPQFDSAKLMQIGGFWAEPAIRRITRNNVLTLNRLFQKSLEVARRFRCAALIMRTVPRLRSWYSLFGFEMLPHLNYFDPHWGPVVTMRLRIEDPLSAPPLGYRRSPQHGLAAGP